jgi:hypothetical protein
VRRQHRIVHVAAHQNLGQNMPHLLANAKQANGAGLGGGVRNHRIIPYPSAIA